MNKKQNYTPPVVEVLEVGAQRPVSTSPGANVEVPDMGWDSGLPSSRSSFWLDGEE